MCVCVTFHGEILFKVYFHFSLREKKKSLMAIDRIEWIPLLFGLVVHNLIGGGFAPVFLLFIFYFSRLRLRSTACVIAATIPLFFSFHSRESFLFCFLS